VNLLALFDTYRDVLVVIAVTLSILFYFSYTNWDSLSLWWKNFKYNNFLTGKVRSLAKNPDVNGRWFHSENVVCRDYHELYGKVYKDGDFYDACKEYLAVVGESGRKPLGPFMLIGLFTVLILEAWGFSYTMSGFIDLSASENTRVIITGIVAFAFAVILAFLTHLMGHELYRNGIVKRIRNNWKADESKDKLKTLDFVEKDFEISDDRDVNKPVYQRRLDRLDVGDDPRVKHGFTTLAVVAVVVIGIIITFVRIKTLEVAQTQDAMCMTGESATGGASVSLDDLYSDTPAPPIAAVETSKAAQEKGESEICKATKEGSWATFGMLAILFLVLQAFATWFSHKYGFVGKHSKTAWGNTNKYKTKAQYENAMDSIASNIAQRAQKTLSILQSKMAKVLSGETMNSKVDVLINTASERTFLDFIEEISSRNRRTQTTLTKDQEHTNIMGGEQSTPSRSSVSEGMTSDENIEKKLPQEAQQKALSDEDVERQLLEEMKQEQESPEEQRARILEKLKTEGKL
jgi:hypothetical protein